MQTLNAQDEWDDILAEDIEIAKDVLEKLRETDQIYIVGHDYPISVSETVFKRTDLFRRAKAYKFGIPENQFEFEDLLGIWTGLVPEELYGKHKGWKPGDSELQGQRERQPGEGLMTKVHLRSGKTVTVDEGCSHFMKEVNDMGHKTIQSCSGIIEEHPGATCGWNMSMGYVSFLVSENPWIGESVFDFPPDLITPYAIELYNAINRAGWHAKIGKTLFTPSVTAYPAPLHKSWGYILYGKDATKHNMYEYLEKNDPEALENPQPHHREWIEAGPWSPEQKQVLEKMKEYDNFICEQITQEKVMSRKWDDLLEEISKVKPPEELP